jgi:hypothetical protein
MIDVNDRQQPTRASLLDPSWASAFNVVGGRYVQPCQDNLWYMTARACCFSVPCFRVHDPGGIERSRRRCIGPAFERVLIFPDITRASDFGCDLPWFAMQRRGLCLFSPSSGL